MGRRNRKRKDEENPLNHPARPERAEHLTGEVDEWNAQLERDAGGAEALGLSEEELERQAAEALPDADTREELAADEIDEVPGDKQKLRATAKGGATGQPTPKGGFRLFQFFRASWAELQRVQWPDRRQVAQATAVVLGFVVIAGAYLGLADAAAQKVIDFIL
jgi:preprotein translocase subunit SecE